MTTAARCFAACVAVIAGVSTARPAAAYEFEVRARTIGQGLALRVFRPITGDATLSRRRFTQVLTLSIWNLGDRKDRDWSRYTPRKRGPKISVSGTLRVDHDFADWVSGSVDVGGQVYDAVDLVPELEENAFALDVMTLYVAAEELWDGRLDIYAGRQLTVGSLEWFSYDGVTARVHTPANLMVEGFTGVRVRDSSYLASSVTELDGTATGQCREYVEGSVPGSGAWRPIDLGTDNPNAFRNDFDLCPQRDELQPTFGLAVASEGLEKVTARLSYRRTVSKTPGIIGPTDRFDEPDLGFYPNGIGQAPGWGTNEEKLTATVRGHLKSKRGDKQLTPYAAARYSVVHGLVDEAHLGTQARSGAHMIEPEVFYSFPTFDGDSIFNVFSIQPYWDFRVNYTLQRPRSSWAVLVRPWARRFLPEDPSNVADGVTIDRSDWSVGGHAGAQYRFTRRDYARVDGFWEDGYGGRRRGGMLAGAYHPLESLGLRTRLSLIDFKDELLANFDGVNFGAQLGGSYRIYRGIAASLQAEYNHNRFNSNQVRVFAILDLAFRPEL